MWKVYILECRNGTLYTGLTDNWERRFHELVSGKGGHYTSCNKPDKVLYFESFNDRLTAEERERQIKRWSRAKKLALIRGDRMTLRALSKSRD